MKIVRDEKGRFAKGTIPPTLSKESRKKQVESHSKWYTNPDNAEKVERFKKNVGIATRKHLDELKKQGKYDEYIKQLSEKVSKAKKGTPFTEEHKAAIKKGHFSKKPNRDEVLEKISISLKKGYDSGEIQHWSEGLTKETDERLRNSKASQPHSKEWNENVSIGLNNSKKWKEYIKSEKHKEDCSKGGVAAIKSLQLRPNKPEQKFIDLCKKYNLPYRYVGDGQFWLGYPPRNPDFLNVNGEKTVVEIHGVYWHLLKPQKKDPDLTRKIVEFEEQSHYSKYGFKSVVIWDDELDNTSLVLDKLRG